MSRNRQARLSDLLNDLTFKVYYDNLKLLALNMFIWEGLPLGIKPEYIERVLFTYGRAIFFSDDLLGLMCLKAVPNGQVNVYEEQINYRAVGFNYSEPYSIVKNAVLIKNNALMIPTEDYIMLYCNKITEIERTMDTNIKQQKLPYIVACDDKDKLTFQNMISQVDGNKPCIYADKGLNLKAITILPTTAPFIADKLVDLKHTVYNEVLTHLGINNANTDKKERLVTDEVQANNDLIDFNVNYMLTTREDAVNQINAMYGTSIKVHLKEDQEDGAVYTDHSGDNRE